jgi:hypothetical protein
MQIPGSLAQTEKGQTTRKGPDDKRAANNHKRAGLRAKLNPIRGEILGVFFA